MKTSIYLTTLLLCVSSTFLYGFGSVEEAKFKGVAQQSFLSPENQDGKFDTIDISFEGTVDIPKNLKIVEFFFRLYNSDGKFLFSINKELDKATSIPDFSYDGRTTSGTFLEDGTYVYTVGILDEKGVESISQPYTLHVDNTVPEVYYANISSGSVVVPNEEDTTLRLELEARPEVSWSFQAENTDTRRSYTLFERSETQPFAPPSEWDWQGVDSSNTPLPDGNYVLNLLSEDQAGNKLVYKVATPIIISSEGSFILIAPENVHFSPNADGERDELAFEFTYPESLRLGIDFTLKELVVHTLSGKEVTRVPQSDDAPIIFNGFFLDGIPLPDAEYNVSLVFVNNKVDMFTNAVSVVVDTAEPLATFFMQTSPEKVRSGDPFYFGGEKRSMVNVRVRRLDKAEWIAVVAKDAELVFSAPLAFPDDSDTFTYDLPADITLQGKNPPDGLYAVSFYSKDRAGNMGQIGPFKAIKDTKQRSVTVTVARKEVSALIDPLVFGFEYDHIGIDRFGIFIRDAQGRTVRSTSLPYGLNSFEWYARNDLGQRVENGNYSFTVSIEYFNGSTVSSVVEDILVDSDPPAIETFTPSTVLINPNSATEEDRYLSVEQRASEEGVVWTMEIRNIFDKLIYSTTLTNDLNDFRWDGKDSDGELVLDGDYVYRLIGRDTLGNEVVKTVSFVVNTGGYESGRILRPDDEMPMIYFPGYSDDIFSLSEKGLLYDNLLYVRSIARLLKAFPQYDVTIVGNAAHLLSGKAAEREQLEVLIPLSRARAAQIRKALRILGIDETRISIRAVGGANPLVENPGPDFIWKNRRVEFELAEQEAVPEQE